MGKKEKKRTYIFMKELNQWGKNIYQSNGENNYEEERKKLTLHT